jgi:predicted Zn finger-like uncharacterized protein
VIVQCPGCEAKFRFDESRIKGTTARVRCRRCGTPFPVERPAPQPDLREPEETGFPAGPAGPVGASGGDPAWGPRTALLADYPREFRDFVKGTLEEAGFEVSLTDNGEEALLAAATHRFDLIVLNVFLRKALGVTVCERIKSTPGLQDTPVLLVGTSLHGEGSARSSFGADGFVDSSAGREDLLDEVSRLCGRRPAAPPPPASVRPSPRAPEPRTAEPAAAEAPPAPAAAIPLAVGDEGEIRRLARIMVSDIQMYHPEKFNRALRDGTFFEAFSDELGRGKEIIDHRFAHLSNRIQILSAGLRDTLEGFRNGTQRR